MQNEELDTDQHTFSDKHNRPDIAKLKDFGWLSNNTDRDNLINSPYYKSIRKTIHKEFDSNAIEFNELNALHVLGRCNNPDSWSNNIIENKQGLVYGMVQSGKTANMLCLAGLGIAAGYNFIILLSSSHNSLRRQTQDRINKALELNDFNGSSINPSIKKVQSITTMEEGNDDYKPKDPSKLENYLINNDTVIACVKKNKDILGNFLDDFKSVKKNNSDLNNIKTLIIDDEADFASIDTNSPSQNSSAINKQLVDIRKIIPKNCYVQYTATPQACIAADTESLVGYPKDFLWLLDVYKEKVTQKTLSYVGHNEFFNDYQSQLLVPIIKEAFPYYIKDEMGDVKKIMTYKGPKTKVPKDGGIEKVIDSTLIDFITNNSLRNRHCYDYNKSIMDFIITCAIRWHRHYTELKALSGNTNPPDLDDIKKDNQENKKLNYPFHAMILNLVYKKEQHKQLLKLIDLIFQSVKKDYYEGDKVLFDTLYKKQQDKSSYFDKTIPSKDDLKRFIDYAFIITEEITDSNEYIYILNSDPDTGQQLNYESNNTTKTKKAAIIIGGHSLSRGLTVNNLSVSFFIRSQVSSLGDTNLQMCRWFGHKRKHIDLISVYLMGHAKELYQGLSKVDDSLRNEFKESIHKGMDPECFLISLQNNHLFAATSPRKSKFLAKNHKSSYSDGRVKAIHRINTSDGHEKNDSIVKDFLEKKTSIKQVHSRKARVYLDVDQNEFKAFFKKLSISSNEIYTPENYLSYLDEYKKNNKTIPKINIALFGYEKTMRVSNRDFYYGSYTGGTNKPKDYAGDKWIDQSKKFHIKYFKGDKPTRRTNNQNSILISFYRFNRNYVFDEKIKLTADQERKMKEGDEMDAYILYTIITPVGGPRFKVSYNKKRLEQKLLIEDKCEKWEENNSVYEE